jgi:tetratricopeptide (TPR) repeat protein
LLLEEKQKNAEQELEKTKKELEEKYELKKENLLYQKDQVAWWLNILGIVVTLFGVGVPIGLGILGFRYAKRIDDEVEKSKKRIDDFIKLYESYLNIQKDLFVKEVIAIKEKARVDANEINDLKKTAKENFSELMNLPREKPTPEIAEKGKELAKKVIENTASSDIEKSIAQTSELFYSHKYAEVIKSYEEMLKNKFVHLNKDQLSTIYFQLGYSFSKEKNNKRAIEYYTNAIALDLFNYAAYNNRGYAYFKLEMYELAIADCNKMIELEPNDVDARINKTEALICSNNLEESIILLNELNKLESKNKDKFGLYFLELLYSILNNTNSKTIEEYFEKIKTIVNNDSSIINWSFEEIKRGLNSRYHENTLQEKKDFIFALIDKIEAWRNKK